MVGLNDVKGRIVYGDLHLDFVTRRDQPDIYCEIFYVLGDGARMYEATITTEPPEADIEVVFKSLNHAEFLQGLQNFEVLG